MKKKLLSMFLLLTLLFTAACNKEKTAEPTPTAAPTETQAPTATPEPTATPTPTPTPVPENLALAALESLSDSLDFLMEYTPEETSDYSDGIGMDMSMNLTVNPDIMALFGLTDLESIRLDGSYDIKDIMATNFTFFLGESDLLNFQMITDLNQFFFNLPKYSNQYAGFLLEDFLDSTGEEIEWEEIGTPAASGLFSDDAYQVIRTNTTLDSASLTTNMEMTELLYTYLKRFVDCFQPQEGSEDNVSIGTGDYTMTGKKYTVSASAADLQAVIDAMAADPKMPEVLAEELDTLLFDGFNSFVMNYYVNESGSYAWEIYPDTQASKPVVFISAPTGFCLYSSENGTDNIAFYTVTTGEGTGTITIPATEEGEADICAEYSITDENNASVHMLADTMEFTMNVSKTGDTVNYDYTVVVDGLSIVLEATVVPQKKADFSISLASYGMLIGTLGLQATFRDYNEIPMPQDSVDMDTWAANLDMEAFSADLEQLLTDYPALAELLLGTGEEELEEGEPYIPDENYSDAFMNMTGYSIDEDGFVDFIPLEEEVLAIGEPSTACDTIPLTEQQKQALLDFLSGLFEDYYYDVTSYYSIWGSVKYDTVESWYQTEHYYSDNNDNNNYIFLNFDAVSGEFIDISICTGSQEKTIQAANEVLSILGAASTITVEDLAEYIVVDNLALSVYNDESSFSIYIMPSEE